MNKTLNNLFKGDKVIWMVFFFLCIVSIIEVYSASSQLTYKGGSYLVPMVKHAGLLALGIFFMLVTMNVQCKYFKIFTPFLLLLSLVMLIWVLVAGEATNGASRWVGIMDFKFQPSEIAKGSLVLATAQILSAMQGENGADRRAFGYILSVCAVIVSPILLENFSTAALICVVIFMMMVIGRVPIDQLGRLIGVTMLVVVVVVTMTMLFGNAENTEQKPTTRTEQVETEKQKDKGNLLSRVFHRFDTWKARIESFSSNEEVPPEKVDLDKDGQVAHANIAIASSNIVGCGPGNSVERDFLSQAFSDFIYAIIIEETGFIGAFFVALLYIVLLFRTGRIASHCENAFPAFLAMGLALMLVTQALFNMCVAVGLAPVTGQPLPLISKGGTSSVINCIYVGAILSVSRSAKKKEDNEQPAVATNVAKA